MFEMFIFLQLLKLIFGPHWHWSLLSRI